MVKAQANLVLLKACLLVRGQLSSSCVLRWFKGKRTFWDLFYMSTNLIHEGCQVPPFQIQTPRELGFKT